MKGKILMMIAVIAIVAALLISGCKDTAVEQEEVVSRRVTVEQWFEKYGETRVSDWWTTESNIMWWKPVPSEEYKLAAAVPYLDDPWWVANAYGLQQAATELGVTIDLYAADGYGDVEGQLAIMDDIMVGDYDGIAFAAVDSVGMTPSVTQAFAKNLFVAYNAVPTQDIRTLRVAYNNEMLGYVIGSETGKKWPNIKVVAFMGPPGLAWPDLIGEPMIRGLEENGCTILEKVYLEQDPAVIMARTEDILTTHPDVQGIICVTDYMAKNVIAALRGAGKKPGEIITAGEPIDPEGVEYMREGWYNLAATTEVVLGSRLSIWALVHMLEGNAIPANIYLESRAITLDTLDQELAAGLEGKEYAPSGWSPPTTMK